MSTKILNTRIGWELNESEKLDDGRNEHGENTGKGIIPRFSRKADNEGGNQVDCRSAFRAYFCYINFPRCDTHDHSLLTCKSACVNYFKACNYEEDLVRCGPSQWFNGDFPERQNNDGDYMRDMFPGQPFRDYNKFNTWCTPSIKGAAPGRGGGGSLALGLAAPLAATVLLLHLWQ